MTNNNDTHPVPGPDDPRYNFAQVISVIGDLIRDTDPAHMGNSTPCPEYNVNQLTAHVVAVLARVAAVGRGEDPFSVPQVAEPPTQGTWHNAWMARAHEVRDVWADPAVLERDLTLPFGVLPGALALTIYCGEFAVHGWDLATATGRTVVFDDAWLVASLEPTKFGVPAAERGPEMPFTDVIAVPDNAPVVDQLAGWLGRNVNA